MKIAILGYSGSGKSTLAGFLGQKYNVPVLYLDTVQFLPGWQERDKAQAAAMVQQFMEQNPSWVIDGNYSAFLQKERLRQADHIIFMGFNRFCCLWRVCKRYRKYFGRTRESMAQGCSEKLDMEFVQWVLFKGRSKSRRDHYYQALAPYKNKVTAIKNQKQLDAFMAAPFEK